MKIGMVNKLTIMNRFVLHTLQRNITHLAVITLKTNINIGILIGGGGSGQEPINCIKTCQREQVNKFLQHFLHANAV